MTAFPIKPLAQSNPGLVGFKGSLKFGIALFIKAFKGGYVN